MNNNPGPWTVDDVLKATGGRLISGAAGARFRGISIDSRTIRRGDLFVAIAGDNYDGHDFLEKACRAGAPGVLIAERYPGRDSLLSNGKVLCIVVADTLKALGDLAAFHRRKSPVSVVAVTGTNGKTTTKEMAAAVLGRTFKVLKTPGNFNNLVGLPLTLFGLDAGHEWAVLEIAMNRPGEIRRLAEIAKPNFGVITNIGAGHLEGVQDLDGVMAAKGELLDVLGQDGIAALNADDERVARLAARFHGRVVAFGIYGSAEVWGAPVGQTLSGACFDLGWRNESTRVTLKIPGMGAVYNALAAAAVGYGVGLPMVEIKKGLEQTAALPGRMEIMALTGDIHLVNDTYNANPASVSAAIKALDALKGDGRGLLVIGDMLELGEHARNAHKEIGIKAARAGLSGLFATGEFAGDVADGAAGAGMDTRKIHTGTKEALIQALEHSVKPGDWLLIKGSRRMAMDQVVDKLRSHIGANRRSGAASGEDCNG